MPFWWKKKKPPKLYDLTTLQRETNQLYSFTAQQTLENLQLLYEKKPVTYPRTDSRYLTEDMAAGLPGLYQVVAGFLTHGKVKITGLYSEKKDVCYDAVVVMEDNGGKYVNFKLEFGQKNGLIKWRKNKIVHCLAGKKRT